MLLVDVGVSAVVNRSLSPGGVASFAAWLALLYWLLRGTRYSPAAAADDVRSDGHLASRSVGKMARWAWYRGVAYPAHGYAVAAATRLVGGGVASRADARWTPAICLLPVAALYSAVTRLFAAEGRLRSSLRDIAETFAEVRRRYEMAAFGDYDDLDDDLSETTTLSSHGDMGDHELIDLENVQMYRPQRRRQRLPHRSVSRVSRVS